MAYLALGVIVAAVQAVRLAPAPLSADAHSVKALYAASVTALTSPGSIIVEIDSVDAKPSRAFLCRLSVTGGNDGIAEGDVIRFRAALLPAGRSAGIPELRTRHWAQLSRRITAEGAADAATITVTGHRRSLATVCADARRAIEKAVFASGMNHATASLLIASCFGKSDSELPVRDTFRAAGIAHLLCVSGFHVGIVAALLAFLLWPLRLWSRVGRIRYALLIVAVWLYIVVTGTQPPAVRAGIMITVYMLARLLQTPTNPLNSLFLAVGIMLCVDPYWLYSAGFQLSVAAVAGLIIFLPKLNPVPGRRQRLHRAVDILLVPVAAILGSAPVLLLWFNALPVTSLPVSILVSATFPAFMAAGAAIVVLSALGWNMALPSRILDGWCALMEKACDKAADLPLSATHVLDIAAYAPALTAIAVCLFAAALYALRPAAKTSLSLAAAAVVIIALLPSPQSSRVVVSADSFRAHIAVNPPAGQGIAAMASDTAAEPVRILLFDRRCRLHPDSVIAARRPDIVLVDICPPPRTAAIVDACRRTDTPFHLLARADFAADIQ